MLKQTSQRRDKRVIVFISPDHRTKLKIIAAKRHVTIRKLVEDVADLLFETESPPDRKARRKIRKILREWMRKS